MATIVTAAELVGDVEAFLRFKRAMGAPYRRGQWDLESFVSFVARHEVPLDEAIRRWCERIPGRKAVTLGNEFGPIRQLCLHRRRRDPSSYVPEHALAPVKEQSGADARSPTSSSSI
jgi:integrase/recombinase XerD